MLASTREAKMARAARMAAIFMVMMVTVVVFEETCRSQSRA